MFQKSFVALLIVGAMVMQPTAGHAGASLGVKCEAAKLKSAGKYIFCTLSAESKQVKTGKATSVAKCVATLDGLWSAAETKASGQCVTDSDLARIQGELDGEETFIAQQLAGLRYIDDGDGTVTDVITGLMWEKKDGLDMHANAADPSDADNAYTWSSGALPNGGAFTDFLGALNNGVSVDASVTLGCFIGHCDWRLPTAEELAGIVDFTQGACGGGSGACIDPIFGPTAPGAYWTLSSHYSDPPNAWAIDFSDGSPVMQSKTLSAFVRAVRKR